MTSAQSLREYECAERKHTFRRAEPQNASPCHFCFLSMFRANLSRDTVAVLVLICCQLHIFAAKTAHRFETDRDD
jgi:hypothetical protein